ncbi:hypothetical protein RRF57_011098 [Xylaria bambusicola]|uniref:Uncharacterized protein n=1 Tax=Xylaria bambusicola TaxID=326684 RepID=A0AAN7UY21_9PEZI
MSSASKNEGRQSPPPQQQSGAQLHDAPASGQGTDNANNKDQTNQDQLKVRNCVPITFCITQTIVNRNEGQLLTPASYRTSHQTPQAPWTPV